MLNFILKFNLSSKISDFYKHFGFFSVDRNKNTTRWSIAHCEDDDVHKVPHEI